MSDAEKEVRVRDMQVKMAALLNESGRIMCGDGCDAMLLPTDWDCPKCGSHFNGGVGIPGRVYADSAVAGLSDRAIAHITRTFASVYIEMIDETVESTTDMVWTNLQERSRAISKLESVLDPHDFHLIKSVVEAIFIRDPEELQAKLAASKARVAAMKSRPGPGDKEPRH